MDFSRQEYWSGLPFPSPEDLPDPGTEPKSLASPALAGGFFTTSATWEAPVGHSLVGNHFLPVEKGEWNFSGLPTGDSVGKNQPKDQRYLKKKKSITALVFINEIENVISDPFYDAIPIAHLTLNFMTV